MKGILFDDFVVEIDPRSVGYGGSWQGERTPDGTPTAWDPDLLWFFYQKLSAHPSPVYLDIGASFGSYCLLTKFLDCHCHAFEPLPFVNEVLKENVALNDLQEKVTVWDLAISDGCEYANLFVPQDCDLGMACLGGNPQRFSPARTEFVPCHALDELPNLGKITHVKMDIEGHELMALKGGELTIRYAMPSLLLEYDERNVAQFGYTREEIVNLLQSWGYSSFEFLGPDGRDLWATP